ncbi:MAG TPA: hypothetical protein VN769_11475, partial [Xanthobacteraceae bacterium]|nr:hypothetical protein [Xanthobacteraceae bacterium]
AMMSDIASAKVASNSTPAWRRLENLFSVLGDAKPTIPVSSVMAIILVILVVKCRITWRQRNVAPDLGGAVEK